MKVYITGNFIYEGKGYHGETLEVTEFVGNKLINDKHAIPFEQWEQQQERVAKEKKEREAVAASTKKPFTVISAPKKTKADEKPGSNIV